MYQLLSVLRNIKTWIFCTLQKFEKKEEEEEEEEGDEVCRSYKKKNINTKMIAIRSWDQEQLLVCNVLSITYM